MKFRTNLFTIFFGASLFLSATARARTPSAGDVSVRLRPLKGVISVSGTNLRVASGEEGAAPVVLLQAKGFDRLSFRFTRSTGRDMWEIIDPISEKRLATISDHRADIRGEGIRVDLRPAPAHLELVARTREEKTNLNLVGFFSVEEYLEGVVASEVPTDWPSEALKAQAIAARSFTVAKIRERTQLRPDWLLESNVTDQVFDFERRHAHASTAVRATAGEVLIDEKAVPVAANYHSDCGGQTDEPRAIWGGGIKTGTAIDRGCSASPRNPWRFVSSLPELTDTLFARRLLPTGFSIASLAIVRRSQGGRALELEARARDGRRQSVSGERLREALGYGDLKSTLFQLKMRPAENADQIEFTGRGFGHGSGLCQWGSRQLALNGKTYREILRHYYPLLKLSAPVTPPVPFRGPGVSPQAELRHPETLSVLSHDETLL